MYGFGYANFGFAYSGVFRCVRHAPGRRCVPVRETRTGAPRTGAQFYGNVPVNADISVFCTSE